MKRLLLLLLLILPSLTIGEGLSGFKIPDMVTLAEDDTSYVGYEYSRDSTYLLQSFMIRGIPGKQGVMGILLSGNPGSAQDIQRDTDQLLKIGKDISAIQDALGLGMKTVQPFTVQKGIVFWDKEAGVDYLFLTLDDGKLYLSVRSFNENGTETVLLLNDREGRVSRLRGMMGSTASAQTSGSEASSTAASEPSPTAALSLPVKSEVSPTAEPSSSVKTETGATTVPVKTDAVSKNETQVEGLPGPDETGEATPSQFIRIKGTDAVSVYFAPYKASEKIGKAMPGTRYPVFSITDNGWFEIQLESGLCGYISSGMVRMVK